MTMETNRDFPRWASLLFIAMGLYIVLLSQDVVVHAPYTARQKRLLLQYGQLHWQGTSLGVAFICAGIASAFGDTRNWLIKINLVVLLASLIAPIISITYFHSDSLLWQVWVSFILFITVFITAAHLLTSRMHSKKPPAIALGEDPVENPLHDAEVHLSWGRTEQAVAILEKAMQRYPSRAAEFQRKLRIIRQDT